VTRRVRRRKLELKREKEEVLKNIDPKAALQGMVQAAVQKAVGEVKMDVDATPTDVRPSTVHDHDDNLIKALRPTNGQSPEGASGSHMSKIQENKKAMRKTKASTQRNPSSNKGQRAKEWNCNAWWKKYKSSKSGRFGNQLHGTSSEFNQKSNLSN
jgi:hypothetical protein